MFQSKHKNTDHPMRLSYVLFMALFIVACQPKKIEESTDFISEDEVKEEGSFSITKKALKKEEKTPVGKPIWGYRFVLVGDFDGDQVQDTLMERYVNRETNQETNKFFEDVDLLSYQGDRIDGQKIFSYMVANNTALDTFLNTSDLGISYAETIGDIDGDGADEVGIVKYHADYSSMNTYYIYTYKKGWKLYYSFEVREWEFPDLPEYNTNYGLFGAMGNTVIKDSIQNTKIQEAITAYKCVEMIAPNTIQYRAFDVGNCAVNYIYKTYEDSVIWVVPEFPIEDEKIISVWTEYELYPSQTLEMIQKQHDSIEICDPASQFRQRVQFKNTTTNNHLVQ